MKHKTASLFPLKIALYSVFFAHVCCGLNFHGPENPPDGPTAKQTQTKPQTNLGALFDNWPSAFAGPSLMNGGPGILTPLGGEAQSRPCCVSSGPGRVDCFIRGPESHLLHKTIEGGVQTDWDDLEGILFGDIECVSRDEGVIDVLVVGIHNVLWIKTYANKAWGPWQSTKSKALEVPGCTAPDQSTVVCVTRGLNNEAYVISYANGAWSPLTKLGGLLRTPIGCSSRAAWSTNCFGSDENNRLNHRWYRNGIWREWQSLESLGKLVRGRPCMTTWEENRLDTFVLDMSNSVLHLPWNRNWLPWIDMGGVFDTMPDCVTTGVGKIYCFGVGRNSYFYTNSFDGQKWAGWVQSFGYFLETPSCLVVNDNEISCYVRTYNRAIAEITYKVDELSAAAE